MIWIVISALCNIGAGVLLKYVTKNPLVLKLDWSGLLKFQDTPLLAAGGGVLLLYGLALVTYMFALRVYPLAVAYIAVVGITTLGLSLAGWLFWGESFTGVQTACAAMIVLGVSGFFLLGSSG